MNIIELFESFRTNQQAVEYLEKVRWPGKTICPYCHGDRTCLHKEKGRKVQRWQCWVCKKSFAVTVGTVFHRTHVPLKKWFLILTMMLNAKKSASSCQIARDLGMHQATVWSIMHRIRAAMALDPEQKSLFHGIVEADETYIGGKPRKVNRKIDRLPSRRGRGTLPRLRLSEFLSVAGVSMPKLRLRRAILRQTDWRDSLLDSSRKTERS